MVLLMLLRVFELKPHDPLNIKEEAKEDEDSIPLSRGANELDSARRFK